MIAPSFIGNENTNKYIYFFEDSIYGFTTKQNVRSSDQSS